MANKYLEKIALAFPSMGTLSNVGKNIGKKFGQLSTSKVGAAITSPVGLATGTAAAVAGESLLRRNKGAQ